MYIYKYIIYICIYIHTYIYIYIYRYKRNATNVDLNKAARIASTFSEETPTIKRKFLNTDYPHRFLNSVIKRFNEKCNGNTQDDYIILPVSLIFPNR